MIEQGFNYADSSIKEMTDFYETRVENLEPVEDKNKSSTAATSCHEIPQENQEEEKGIICYMFKL